ncbi:hypothetical protein [Photobacterium kishitanii]|uniref:Uncharacterized protein n=1 Tax=Photobacterium kishitanii TaxID=318456 RepID=A0A2T3KLF3_9GAMM|nr:hypothetical protein [Photobacterium kishitanii]PSV00545.1 hypothetical protein C9J27_05265 [Photobacterium kishitanii]
MSASELNDSDLHINLDCSLNRNFKFNGTELYIDVDNFSKNPEILKKLISDVTLLYVPKDEYPHNYWYEYSDLCEKELSKDIRKAMQLHKLGYFESTKDAFIEIYNERADSDIVEHFEDYARVEHDTSLTADIEKLFFIEDKEELYDLIFAAIVQRYRVLDNSTVIDIISPREKIEFSYVAVNKDTDALDTTTQSSSLYCDCADEALEQLFKLAKLSSLHFAEALKESDLFGQNEQLKLDTVNKFLSIKAGDFSENELILKSSNDMIDIIDNASFGGTPLLFGFVAAKDIIEAKLGEQYTLSGSVNIGLIDFSNGSGYITGAKECTITFNPENIIMRSDAHISVDQIFGLCRDQMYIKPID